MKPGIVSHLSIVMTLAMCFTSCKDEDKESLVQEGDWVQINSDFPGVERGGAVCFQIGNVAYVGTGANTTKLENNGRYREFYSVSADGNGGIDWSCKWEQLGEGVASMPETYVDEATGQRVNAPAGRNGAVAFTLNGKGYVGLGYTGESFLKDFWEYDPEGVPEVADYPSLPDEVKAKLGSTNCGSWRKIADYPGDLCRYAVAFVLTKNDGTARAYVGTGENYNESYSDKFYSFDGEKWESVPSCGTKRAQATAFTYKASDGIEYGYLVGGEDKQNISIFQRFNPETNSWEQLRNINNSSRESYDDKYNMMLSGSTSFVLPADATHEAKAYLVTGTSSRNFTRSCWEYDLESDMWKEKSDFEGSPRKFAVSFVLEQKDTQTGDVKYMPYVTTGVINELSSVRTFSDVWTFNPF